jgi:hypothetical protein
MPFRDILITVLLSVEFLLKMIALILVDGDPELV